MDILLERKNDTGYSTVGNLYFGDSMIHILEDTYRKEKINGETRIPSGTYEIKLRNEGKMNITYKRRFPKYHKGMLWLKNVPNFEYVYIHIGNTPKDTLGCLLTGLDISKTDFIGNSTQAYCKFYNWIIPILNQEQVFLKITDN